jgi:hypothetical protein
MIDDDVNLDDLERLDRATFIHQEREQNAIELTRDRERLRQRVLNAPYQAPDPVQQWREDADRREQAKAAETRRRHAKEDCDRALEADLAEAHGLLEDAVALIDHLQNENAELKGKGKRDRRRPKKSELEVVDLPAGFLAPKGDAQWPDLVFSQPKLTRR